MDAYTAALSLLSRRELSTRQLRDRLARRHFDAGAIDEAIARLTSDRTLDDRRVAAAAARTAVAVKGRGRRRVLQAVQQLGIAADIAGEAVSDAFLDVDEDALLDRAIDKRLKGRAIGALDPRDTARLVRRLVAQGFDPGAVFARLGRKGAEVDE